MNGLSELLVSSWLALLVTPRTWLNAVNSTSRRTGRCEGLAVCDNARPAWEKVQTVLGFPPSTSSVYLPLHYNDYKIWASVCELCKSIFFKHYIECVNR